MKVWTISMCFMDADIIHDSIQQYYATKSLEVETVHVLVDQHWPINYTQHKHDLELIAKKFGCHYTDPGKNLGLHEGFNYGWRKFAIPDNAAVIGYDPDSWPVTPNWDMAICKLFNARPEIAWFSLWHIHAQRQIVSEGNGGVLEEAAGIKFHRLKRPSMNSVCAFRQEWLRTVGGLFEQNHEYGGLECDMWDKLHSTKKWDWVFLPEYQETADLYSRMNPLYREWKWKYAHTKEFRGDFASYLKSLGVI